MSTSFQKVRAAADKNTTAILVDGLPYLLEMRRAAVELGDGATSASTNLVIHATLDILFERVPQMAADSCQWDEDLDDNRTMAEWVVDWFAAVKS